MAKKSKRDNRSRVQSPAPAAMENRAASMNLSDSNEQDGPEEFPMVESANHLTGEIFDPMALTEQEGLEETTEEVAEETVEEIVETKPDSINDPRFEGKSPEDILKSYKELENKFNERNDELGNYRKMFDQHVQKSFTQQPQQPQVDPKLSEKKNQELLEEMLANPQAFVQKIEQRIYNNLGSMASQHEMKNMMHKNQDTLSSPDFKSWLVNNVPQHIAQLADNDPKTFNWIISTYKNNTAPQAAAIQASEQAVTRRRVAENAAGIPTGGTVRSKPIYTRSSIMKMMRENPAEYERLQGDIMLAYKEGRVK